MVCVDLTVPATTASGVGDDLVIVAVSISGHPHRTLVSCTFRFRPPALKILVDLADHRRIARCRRNVTVGPVQPEPHCQSQLRRSDNREHSEHHEHCCEDKVDQRWAHRSVRKAIKIAPYSFVRQPTQHLALAGRLLFPRQSPKLRSAKRLPRSLHRVPHRHHDAETCDRTEHSERKAIICMLRTHLSPCSLNCHSIPGGHQTK
jgi:hypothetical protein